MGYAARHISGGDILNFNDYQKEAARFAQYPDNCMSIATDKLLRYFVILAQAHGILKKKYRDNHMNMGEFTAICRELKIDIHVEEIYTRQKSPIAYPLLGLVDEVGELVDKALAHKPAVDQEKESGDALWYLSEFTRVQGISLQNVAEGNIKKLDDRLRRGTIRGRGDNR